MSPTSPVTVIIPVFDGERFIGDAIRSVLVQTIEPLELIIVNDGSTDETGRIVDAFDDPRIRQVVLTNRGLAAARNRGIAEATHSLIAFLDADDEWLPDRLEKQLPLMAPSSFVSSDVVFWDETSGELLGRYIAFDRFPEQTEKFTGDILIPLLAQNFIHPSTVLAWKEDLMEHGGFDESLPVAEDWDMWLRLAQDIRHDRVHSPLVKVRKRSDSLQSDAKRLTHFSTHVLESAAERLRAAGRLDDMARTSLGLGFFGARAVSRSRRELLAATVRRPWLGSRWKWACASLIHPLLKLKR